MIPPVMCMRGQAWSTSYTDLLYRTLRIPSSEIGPCMRSAHHVTERTAPECDSSPPPPEVTARPRPPGGPLTCMDCLAGGSSISIMVVPGPGRVSSRCGGLSM